MKWKKILKSCSFEVANLIITFLIDILLLIVVNYINNVS